MINATFPDTVTVGGREIAPRGDIVAFTQGVELHRSGARVPSADDSVYVRAGYKWAASGTWWIHQRTPYNAKTSPKFWIRVTIDGIEYNHYKDRLNYDSLDQCWKDATDEFLTEYPDRCDEVDFMETEVMYWTGVNSTYGHVLGYEYPGLYWE